MSQGDSMADPMIKDSGINIQTLSTRRFKVGYEVRSEIWTLANGDPPVSMKSAYTPSGDYIGNPRDARYLIVKRGIAPEKRTPASNVCSIGYAKRSRQWFGWSHRAIFGFGIGATVTKDHCAAEFLPVGFKAKTLADAKRIACAFAESVS
jgi:hypothetical protein